MRFMTPMKHIRKVVFQMTQKDFADRIGVAQSTVSRWDNGAAPTLSEMSSVRELAQEQSIPWDDSWFFEIPATEAAE